MRDNEDGNALEWDGGIELTAALEISRRQVAEYRDTKHIPNHIALATRYLAERA